MSVRVIILSLIISQTFAEMDSHGVPQVIAGAIYNITGEDVYPFVEVCLENKDMK